MLLTRLRPTFAAGLILFASAAAAQTPAPAAKPPAQAAPLPSPSHLAAARDLVDTIGVLTPLADLLPTFGQQIRQQNVTRPEMTKDLDEVLKGLGPEMELQRQRVVAEVVRTYTKWMSEAELKEVTAFFKTPVGAKYNKVQPDMVEEVVTVVGGWTQEVSEYVMVRARAEMSKRGHQLQ